MSTGRCVWVGSAVGALMMACGMAWGQPVNRGYAGMVGPVAGQCLPLTEEMKIRARIAIYEARFGPLSHGSGDGPGTLYQFYPQGGTLYTDLTTGNFVDLDPGVGTVQNYLCEHYGNDGHEGCDTGGGSWEEMAIGQPIFAALDGTVVDAHDGDPDMNTSCQSGGNYVIIDHGNGRQAWYLHMKKNSVAVSVGNIVKAGQQIGLVGSSGCSFGPHLHFQSMQNGSVFEPFAGPCRPGASGFAKQVDPPSAPFLRDFGATNQDIGMAPPLPARPPVSRFMLFSDPLLYYWAEICNLPANSTWKERYVRPDGSIEYELGPFPFNNPTTYQFSMYWFSRDVPGMHSIQGTWRIQMDINGQPFLDAPVSVFAAPPPFIRPPLPITAQFDPVRVDFIDTPIFARVNGPSGIRDLDFDIVRYHYVWKANGVVIRDVVSPGMADAVPRSAVAASGDILECAITPNDGLFDGATVTLRMAVGCYANCDASTIAPRLNVNDFTCFLNKFAAGDPGANCDQSVIPPVLNVNDFVCFLNRFQSAIGCP